MAHEALELIEGNRVRLFGRQRVPEEHGRRQPGVESRTRTGEVQDIETPWLVPDEYVPFEVAGVEGLERVLDHDRVAGALSPLVRTV